MAVKRGSTLSIDMQNVPYDNIRGIPSGLIKRRNGMGKQAVIRVHKRQIASLNMVHSPVTGFRHVLIFLTQDEEAAVLSINRRTIPSPPSVDPSSTQRQVQVILLLQASQARFKGCGGIIERDHKCYGHAPSRMLEPPVGHTLLTDIGG